MLSTTSEPASPGHASEDGSSCSVDAMLATALQRNMSFKDDRKRQHTPSTANRPRRFRKGAELDCDADQKENSDPVASAKKVTPSRLACIKQLEQEMTCSVCLDICVRPCTTPCGHDFCRKCLKKALLHQRKCPKCRASIPASSPICINTVLWNTIKLLFPKHAANAPESPADAILTPASANSTVIVADAVNALPTRQRMLHAPFNPPRMTRPQYQANRVPPQRNPPSWLEGATRDSDPPASARRHRLALSSHQQQQQQQQQTLPQALNAWHSSQAGPGAEQHIGVASRNGHAQPRGASVAAAAAARDAGGQAEMARAPQMQRSQSAQRLRGPVPSLLDNLQRRLDDLPIPDVLHRNHSSQLQEPAAGLEASPTRLRVRAFPSQPQALPTAAPPAAAAAVQGRAHAVPRLQISHQLQNRQAVSARQPQMVSGPTWDSHAEPPAVRQDRLGSQDWLAGLPDTPEAPRAATAAQRQAIADVLFEAAASESAAGDGEALQAEPSWLSDAAAYDAVAAQMEEDDMSALEILSDDDDSPMVNAVRSQARLNLSTLEQLLLSDDEDGDDGAADQEAGQQPERATSGLHMASDSQSHDRQPAEPQSSASLAQGVIIDSKEEDPDLRADMDATQAAVTRAEMQFQNEASVDQHAARAANPPSSPLQVALGHNGRPRHVLSDVTGSFPAEQQPAQEASQQDGAQPQSTSGFQLQRRGRLPRVCRNLLPGAADSAAADGSSSSGNSQVEGNNAHCNAAPKLKVTLRSAGRAQGSESNRAAAMQPSICTRRQAKLTQQSSQQAVAGSHSSDDDSDVGHQQKRNVRSAAATGAPSLQTSQIAASQSAEGSMASTADQAPVRKNRSRLQLNRNLSKAKPAGS